MKRSLQVLGDPREPPPQEPRMLRVGQRLVRLIDTGDGTASAGFVEALAEAGSTPMAVESHLEPDLRIVIRGTPQTPEARLRAEVLEESADLVLGSVRPGFARVFGLACAHWVNS